MPRRVNKPALAIMTLAVMAMTILAGVLVVRAIPSKDPGPAERRAKEAMGRGEYENAMIFYRQAFSRSQDTKYLVLAGDAAREMGDSGQAFSLWRTAIAQDPNNLEARRHWLSLWIEMLELEGWKASTDIATRITEDAETLLKKEPEDFLGLFARGLGAISLRAEKPELEAQGVEDLTKAHALQPLDERVLTVLAQYWVDKKQPEQAESLCRQVVEGQPDSPTGYLMMGRVLLAQEKYDEAAAQFEQAVARSSGSAKTDAPVSLAQVYMLEKKYDDAYALLQRTIQANPEDFNSYLQMTQVLTARDMLEEAAKTADEWLSKPPVRTGFRSMIYRGQRIRMLIQAGTACVTLASRRVDDPSFETLMQRADEYVKKAEQEAGRSVPFTRLLRGHLERLRGRTLEAVKELETADREFGGTNAQVKLSLAELYHRQGEPGAALRVLNEAIQLAGNYAQAYRMRALVKTALGDRTGAMADLDVGLRLAPDDRDLLQIKEALLRALGRAAEADDIRAHLGPATTPEELLRQAAQRLAEGQSDEAESYYKEVLVSDPANLAALRSVIPLMIQAKRIEEAREVFEKARAKAPDNPRIREIEVLFAEPEQRAAKLVELIQAEPDEFLRNLQLYFYYVAQQNYDEALGAADALAKLKPEDERVISIQFAVALLRKDWVRAQQCADAAARLDMDGAQGGFYRARLAMQQQDWAKARNELNMALQKYPTQSNGWVWLGQTMAGLGEYEEAKKHLRYALELNPTRGEAYKGLAQIAAVQGDAVAYEENIRRALQYLRGDTWTLQQAIALQERRDPQGAIEIREQGLQLEPDDLENVVRLALLYERMGRYDDASRLIERALTLAPRDLDVVWAAASYWQRRGDAARAEKTLLDIGEALEDRDKARATLLLGRIYQQQNLPAKAEQAFVLATKQSQRWDVTVQLAEFYRSIGRTQEAAQWYRHTLEGQELAAADQARVRQRLVEMLLQTRMLDEGAKEIEAYRQALPEDAQYQLMRGTLLMLQGQTQQAVDVLTAFLTQRPRSAPGHYHRGLLHMAMNQLPQAIADLSAAKQIDPNGFNFEHRIALAYACEANGDGEQAVTELKSILETDPDATTVVRSLAALYQRAGRDADLEALLRGYVQRQPQEPSWPTLLGQFSQIKGDTAGAIEAYNQAAKVSNYNTAVVDQLLGVYIAAKQYDRAIEYVEKILPEDKRNAITKARLAEAYLNSGQQDRGRELYREAMAASAQDVLSSLVVVRSITGTLGREQAIAMLNERLAAKADDLVAKYMLVALLGEQKDWEQADRLSAELVAAAQDDQEKAVFVRQRGALLYQAANYEAAARTYEELLKIVKDDGDGLNDLAYIYGEHLGRPAEALPYARRAVELRPKDANVQDTLGWVYYLQGDLASAEGTLLQALQLSPGNLAVRYHIAMVYLKQAKPDQAKRELEQAMQIIQKSPQDVLVPMFQERVKKALEELGGLAAP